MNPKRVKLMQTSARAKAGGYLIIADSLAEVLECDVALVSDTIADLIQSGALPQSRGRRIEPVLEDGLTILAFAVVARSMGMSRVGSRQVAMQWSRSGKHSETIRFDRRPTATCEIGISNTILAEIWKLAEA